MRFIGAIKILGILLMMLSLSNIPPIIVALIYHDGGGPAFAFGFVVTLLMGFALWFFSRHKSVELKTRDGFFIVTFLWLVLSFFGAIPLLVTLFPKLPATDAIFESVSGLTTTGATVLTHLNLLPHSILYYRQQFHLLGGMGIIVLAVAILPMLGVGGMQLFRAEVAGPMKTNKLTPRIAETAKALWVIYFGLAALCFLSYHFAGMSWFDALGDSFSTVSTGGFSMHDASLAYYKSPLIDTIAMFFMILGATNFSLHFQFLKYRRFSFYTQDSEFMAYLKIILVVSVIAAVTLIAYDYYHLGRNFFNALFTVISLTSTTGLSTNDYSVWPSFLPYLVLFAALIGGCSGSTSGGLKVIRCLLLKQQGEREVNRLIHPKAVLALKLGGSTVSDDTMQAVWSYVAVFLALYVILFLCLLATGMELQTAFGALTACLSNTGAGIGKAAGNFAHINTAAKWILILAMFAGRLEIFTVLVLFMPSYWRR